MDNAIDRNNWIEAYELGVYGDCHPDLTVQMIRMLKLHLQLIPDNGSIDGEILKKINELKQAIKCTNLYGDDLYRIFLSIINDLQIPSSFS
ncbi:hypothetical protein BLA29_011201 [Euroglyphus maynei]|uniref:Uncharacterized protein n=1 Tax=Euroglyphus maynei TaxID=6958 RepID=A0A1Y3ALU5_EURMA|nr:hypothetical protein BLA29_011201 [Euroglyphus maynei]